MSSPVVFNKGATQKNANTCYHSFPCNKDALRDGAYTCSSCKSRQRNNRLIRYYLLGFIISSLPSPPCAVYDGLMYSRGSQRHHCLRDVIRFPLAWTPPVGEGERESCKCLCDVKCLIWGVIDGLILQPATLLPPPTQ